MEFKPYLIAFDMDGTLLTEKKTILRRTKRYLKKLIKQGHKIVLASGRPSRAMMSYYNELGLDTPLVCYNGAYVFSPKDPKFETIAFEFPHDVIIDVIQQIRPNVINVMCEDDENIWVDRQDTYLDRFFWYENMNIIYGDLAETLNKDPMTCIVKAPYEYRETNEIENVMEKYPGLSVRFWTGSPYFELYYTGISKGSAVKTIAKYYNIPKERIIAFGDAGNDVEMFENAHISVAMINGKNHKDLNAKMLSFKDNDHNGIYHTLKHILREMENEK